jgi:hypothetical protein
LAPVFEVGGRTNIGARPPPAAGEFASAGTRGGAALSTGRVRDCASAADVIAYLHAVTADTEREDPVVRLGTFHHPPAVRLVEGTDARYAVLAREAVRIVNAALPYGKRLWFDARRVFAPSDALDVTKGEIVIQFAAQGGDPLTLARTPKQIDEFLWILLDVVQFMRTAGVAPDELVFP